MIRGEFWPQAGLLALYHGDNTSDSSGNSHTLSSTGATFETGRLGKAFYFGGNDYLTHTDGLGYNLTGPASISLLLNLSALPGASALYPLVYWSTGTGSGTRVFMLSYSNTSGTRYLNIVAGGTTTSYAVELSTGTWYLIDGTLGTYAKLYLNGSPVASGSRGASTSVYNRVVIGANYPLTARMTGYLDEVALFNYERTEQQIRRRALYILTGVL